MIGKENMQMAVKQAFLVLLWVYTVYCFPQVTDTDSLVISTIAQRQSVESSKNGGPILPNIYEMRVDTHVSNRFAKSQITSKVKNLDKKAQEVTFSVVIPEQAYISGFVMDIDGKKYEAYVQGKEQAQTTYKDVSKFYLLS
ncbi:hypothetical protein JTB14_030399 [Gonioctena quinquepunctata]|nr:hypothetical protein JTB14_030399 [Gonioctena quinquepunctata]